MRTVSRVEPIAAVVGVIGSIIVALLARLTGLTQDGRRRAAIVRDAELWKALPDGCSARTTLAEHVNERTATLIARRKEDRPLERLWGAGVWSAFAAWVLLLASSAVPTQLAGAPLWLVQIRQALEFAVGFAGLVAIGFWFSALLVAGKRAWEWVKARRGATES